MGFAMSNVNDTKIIPPLIPLITMSIGVVLNYFWPVLILNSSVIGNVGWVLIIASFLPAIIALVTLRRAGTTADVRQNATRLVTSGVFSLTRNPMYLAMMILFAGIALAMNSLIILAIAVPTGSLLCLLVIQKEETFLRHEFGRDYSTYLQSVRRWV
jgi:protein-S-isoprenylcysteine O-methyltransferase Ste14